jgi:hypothetical protein
MGKRTLASCWRQFEKLSETYLDESKPRTQTLNSLAVLARKANEDGLGAALATLFVKPYISVPVGVQFSMEMQDGNIPDWVTRYDEATSAILVHPLSVFQYIQRMRAIGISDDDFIRCRYYSFLLEIGQLPSVQLLFLLVMQRVAYLLEIAHLEKRGGVIEVAEGESYHTLLWAFKEVEQFTLRTSGVNIRAHFGISWYESDWITGR